MPFAKFSKFWNLRIRKKTAELDAKQDRARLLVEAVKALPADSPLLLDLSCDITDKKDVHKACKRLLHFIVRNWLAGTMEHADFDPRVFFSNKLVKDSFLKQFGE